MNYCNCFFVEATKNRNRSNIHQSSFVKLTNDSINLQRDFHRTWIIFRLRITKKVEPSLKEGGAPLSPPFSSRGWVTKFHVRTILSPRNSRMLSAVCVAVTKGQREKSGRNWRNNPSFTVFPVTWRKLIPRS